MSLRVIPLLRTLKDRMPASISRSKNSSIQPKFGDIVQDLSIDTIHGIMTVRTNKKARKFHFSYKYAIGGTLSFDLGP